MGNNKKIETLILELSMIEIDINKLNQIKERIKRKINDITSGDLFANDSQVVEQERQKINLILNNKKWL